MDPKYFLNHTVADRMRLLIEDKNVDYIYVLLSKHLGIPVDDLKSRFEISLNHVRQFIDVTSNMQDMYLLSTYLRSHAVELDYLTMDQLRVNFSQLLTKIK